VNFLEAAPATRALLSLALGFWQWLAGRQFPLHQRIADASPAPAVSLLKPFKGCDATTAESTEWRGEKMRLRRDGTLVEEKRPARQPRFPR
jgi:hypothetical protein